MKIDIKNIGGKVIFSFEKEDNTMKDTVEEAVRCGVSLRNTDLRCTNLRGADLHGANLNFSHLQYADLRGANLKDAELRHALLNGTDLKEANLEGADICGTNLIYAKNIPDLPFACPYYGEFIGWKKIRYYKEDYDGDFLVKLLIPEDAKRCSATTEKCRCSKAKVLEITSIDTGKNVDVITNINDITCVYHVGEMVYPDSFDNNRWNECSHGIHFFVNRQDAIDY